MILSKYFIITIVFLLLVVVQANMRISSLKNLVEAKEEEYGRNVSSLKDSLKVFRFEIDSLKMRLPGLGEYMTANQTHAAKLWYAAQANNWKLADYELGELEETIEGAQKLSMVKNGVNITNVMESLRQTQIAALRQAITGCDRNKFAVAYDQALEMCNGCHRSVGNGFIRIIRPTREPVVNQNWKAAGEK